MAFAVSWPFPVHACTDEDVNVSYRIGITAAPGWFRGEAVRVGVVELSRISGTCERSCRCGKACGIPRERSTPRNSGTCDRVATCVLPVSCRNLFIEEFKELECPPRLQSTRRDADRIVSSRRSFSRCSPFGVQYQTKRLTAPENINIFFSLCDCC